MKKFYFDGKIENEVVINDDQFTHITKVLRLPILSQIILFNGDGYFYTCQILKIEKKYLIAKVIAKTCCDNVTNNYITLFQGIVKKPDNQTLIIQKMTELGLKKVVFFESDYTNVKLDNNKNNRLEKIVIESCKQCGRADLLKIEQSKFDGVLMQLQEYDIVLFAYENERKKNLNEILNICNNKKIALIVGSEGGFSQAEVNKLEQVGANVITLGKTILRAETAAIALASSVLCKLGEWQ